MLFRITKSKIFTITLAGFVLLAPAVSLAKNMGLLSYKFSATSLLSFFDQKSLTEKLLELRLRTDLGESLAGKKIENIDVSVSTEQIVVLIKYECDYVTKVCPREDKITIQKVGGQEPDLETIIRVVKSSVEGGPAVITPGKLTAEEVEKLQKEKKELEEKIAHDKAVLELLEKSIEKYTEGNRVRKILETKVDVLADALVAAEERLAYIVAQLARSGDSQPVIPPVPPNSGRPPAPSGKIKEVIDKLKKMDKKNAKTEIDKMSNEELKKLIEALKGVKK